MPKFVLHRDMYTHAHVPAQTHTCIHTHTRKYAFLLENEYGTISKEKAEYQTIYGIYQLVNPNITVTSGDIQGSGEMSWWLKALVAHIIDDPGSQWITMAFNSSSTRSYLLVSVGTRLTCGIQTCR